MKMDKAVQIRMPVEMWDHLSTLAAKRAPGTKVTHLIREAIQRSFFAESEDGHTPLSKGKVGGGGGLIPLLVALIETKRPFPPLRD
jgi:hypothetical protein